MARPTPGRHLGALALALALASCGEEDPPLLLAGVLTGEHEGIRTIVADRGGHEEGRTPVEGGTFVLPVQPATRIAVAFRGADGTVALLADAAGDVPAAIEICGPGRIDLGDVRLDPRVCDRGAPCREAGALLLACESGGSSACVDRTAELRACLLAHNNQCTPHLAGAETCLAGEGACDAELESLASCTRAIDCGDENDAFAASCATEPCGAERAALAAACPASCEDRVLLAVAELPPPRQHGCEVAP